MKFITEVDLRDLYKKEPFTTYRLEAHSKLTPGARQFLQDYKISIFNHTSDTKKKVVTKNRAVDLSESEGEFLRLLSKLKSVEALFLLTVEELLDRDVCIAKSVITLNKHFSSIRNVVKNKEAFEDLCCTECMGINESNHSLTLEDCIEITEIHLHLEKSRELLILHRLRCALQEIEPFVWELFIRGSAENMLCEEMIGKVNQIINHLSQLICSVIGGVTCQKQNCLLNTAIDSSETLKT